MEKAEKKLLYTLIMASREWTVHDHARLLGGLTVVFYSCNLKDPNIFFLCKEHDDYVFLKSFLKSEVT